MQNISLYSMGNKFICDMPSIQDPINLIVYCCDKMSLYTIYHTSYFIYLFIFIFSILLLLKGWVLLGHGWKSHRQGSTACQDWTVFIVSSLKENEALTKIKSIIAKTEYFFRQAPSPIPEPQPPHMCLPPLPTTRKILRPHAPFPPSRGSHPHSFLGIRFDP